MRRKAKVGCCCYSRRAQRKRSAQKKRAERERQWAAERVPDRAEKRQIGRSSAPALNLSQLIVPRPSSSRQETDRLVELKATKNPKIGKEEAKGQKEKGMGPKLTHGKGNGDKKEETTGGREKAREEREEAKRQGEEAAKREKETEDGGKKEKRKTEKQNGAEEAKRRAEEGRKRKEGKKGQEEAKKRAEGEEQRVGVEAKKEGVEERALRKEEQREHVGGVVHRQTEHIVHSVKAPVDGQGPTQNGFFDCDAQPPQQNGEEPFAELSIQTQHSPARDDDDSAEGPLTKCSTDSGIEDATNQERGGEQQQSAVQGVGITKFACNVFEFVTAVNERMEMGDKIAAQMAAQEDRVALEPIKVEPLNLERIQRCAERKRERKPRMYKLVDSDIRYCEHMIREHGEDFEAMSLDPKNVLHDSAVSIQRKLRVYREFLKQTGGVA